MKKIFLLLYNDEFGSREEVKKAVNDCPYVITWRYDMPHCFYLVSEASAKQIATALHDARGKGRIVVTEAGNDYWGWSTKETWYLFENKRLMPAGKS